MGHYENFLKYPFFKKSGRTRRITERRKDKAFREIKNLIDSGVTSTNELASGIGRDRRQIRRYLVSMAARGMIDLDPQTKRLVTEVKPESFLETFADIPEIAKWVDDCIARDVKQKTIMRLTRPTYRIFGTIKAKPKDVIESKKTA